MIEFIADLGLRPSKALWILLALAVLWMMYRFQRRNKHYDVADVLMNHSVSPPRADLTSHMIFIALLTWAWAVVVYVGQGKLVTELILGGLTIFVLRQAVKIGADAYVAKPSAPEPEAPASRDVNVNVAQQPVNPLAAKAPVPVQVANKEPVRVREAPPKRKGGK